MQNKQTNKQNKREGKQSINVVILGDRNSSRMFLRGKKLASLRNAKYKIINNDNA